MSLELSLYTIESDLSNLIEMREQAQAELYAITTLGESPERTEATEALKIIDDQIGEYIGAEIRKVDNIRAFWRHCELMRDAAKEEARVQSDRSKAWASRLDRLKETCRSVMETIPFPTGKPRKLEGRTGSLTLKANGGKQAVEVTDESLVPDELCMATVMMSAALWKDFMSRVLDNLSHNPAALRLVGGMKVIYAPSLSLIGEALQGKCGPCSGTGSVRVNGARVDMRTCPECGGSGHQSVPGCRLSPRSNHVECK